MTPTHGRGLLHLAAAVDHETDRDGGRSLESARLAERGGLDFVTLGAPGDPSGPDALAVLSGAAAVTTRVGLVPALPGAGIGTELLRARAAVAGLDRVSRGRAGCRIEVPGGEEEPAEGRVEVPYSGPGHPVLVIDATEEPARAVAARYADVALLRVVSPDRAAALRARLRSSAGASGRDPDGLRVLASLLVDLGDGERAAERGHGGGGPRQSALGPLYRGGPVDLAELVARWHAEGVVDGFHFVPVEPVRDLERLVNGTVALLQHRGLFRTFYPGSTLREHLDLAGPARRYATTGGPG